MGNRGGRWRWVIGAAVATAVLLAASLTLSPQGEIRGQARRTLWWGTSGSDVVLVQTTLRDWGYYRGPIDGYYGYATWRAVLDFQRTNGLIPDGVVGPSTWSALGYWAGAPTYAYAAYTRAPAVSRGDDVDLLARVVEGEAEGEPYEGKVAVAAVILNRVRHPSFPNTLSGVIFQPWAFESVDNGRIWRLTPSASSYRAAQDALNGWDPTYGAIYFWNPFKAVNPWVWTRTIIRWIGSHVFAR